MGKFLTIPLKLNFTPNTLGCYGLSSNTLLLITWSMQSSYSASHIFASSLTAAVSSSLQYPTLYCWNLKFPGGESLSGSAVGRSPSGDRDTLQAYSSSSKRFYHFLKLDLSDQRDRRTDWIRPSAVWPAVAAWIFGRREELGCSSEVSARIFPGAGCELQLSSAVSCTCLVKDHGPLDRPRVQW